MLTAVLSHRLEILFDSLKKNLFTPHSHPFTKRIVILPSSAMGEWLKFSLAEDSSCQIAAGISFFFLNQAVFHLAQSKRTPTYFEWTLCIENEVRELTAHFSELDSKDKNLFLPLLSYLKVDADPLWKPKSERRLHALCRKLAVLFNRYGIYGSGESIIWEKDPQNWQEGLWGRIFGRGKHREYLLPLPTRVPEDLSLHLFAFSHLPSAYLKFFSEIQARVDIYHLSPCQLFWSDILSDREIKRMRSSLKEEKFEALEDYILDRNPLLANLGKVGRSFAFLLEEFEITAEEKYERATAWSLLEIVQEDILTLRNPEEEEPRSFSDEDHSIQCHISSSPLREIENLYNTLLGLIQEFALEPRDIHVMAPDISYYEPFIRAVFGAQTSKLPFQIADLSVATKDLAIQGLLHLLSLEKNRWNAAFVMQLFNHPLFSEKQGWDRWDLEKIHAWIQKTEIRWGIDLSHRNRLLRAAHCERIALDEKTTWKVGFEKLLSQLAFWEERETLDSAEALLLGKLIALLQNLFEDLLPLIDGSMLSLSEWKGYLSCLAESYFSLDDMSVLEEQLSTLEEASQRFDKKYCFTSFFPLFEEKLIQETLTIHPHQLQSVRFCSLLPMRAIPAKVICVIGMNQKDFPRQEKLQSLDLLKGKGEYCPSRSDFDRYLFLEALLSARKIFFLSYLKENPPSIIVQELLSYIDRFFKPNFSETRMVTHPFFPFDPSYFEGARLKTYSEFDYRCACASLEKKVKNELQFQPKEEEVTIPEGEISLSIADLLRLARSPLKHYFQHGHQLFFHERTPLKEEEDFVLTQLQLFRVRQDLLKSKTFDAQKTQGLFSTLSQLNIEKQRDDLLSVLQDQKIAPADIFSIDLPPLRFSYSSKTTVIISGKIDGMTSRGLLVPDKGDIKACVKAWPLLLVLANLPHMEDQANLIFIKSGQLKEKFFYNAEDLLRDYLTYYFYARKNPSLLYPEWVDAIVKKDPVGLEKRLQQSFSDFYGKSYDEALLWAFQGRDLPSSKMIVTRYGDWGERLYKEMIDAWF